MSRRSYLVGVGQSIAAVVAGCLESSCRTRSPGAGDWTQIGHDARHTGAETTRSGVTLEDTHWQVTQESAFDAAGLAVTEDRLFVAGRRRTEQGFRGFLRLRSLTDGEVRRTVEIPAPVIAPPVVTENGILVTCRLEGERACYRSYDFEGEKRWTYELGGPRLAPPTVSQRTVYGGGPNGAVVALGASDGSIRWERRFGDERQSGAIYSPVPVDGDQVYVPVSSSRERGIYALSRDDGQTQWNIPGPRIRSMMVRTDEVLLVSYPSYDLAAFDVQTGERRWSQSFAERRISPPAAGDDGIAISDSGSLYGLNATTGEKRWSLECNPNPGSQPVIVGDTVVVQSESGLVACSVSEGTRRWTVDTGSSGPVVPVENGLVYSPEADTLAAYTNCRQ